MRLTPILRFKSFNTPWSQESFGNIATFKSGNTPSKSNNSFWEGDIPWISASSMYGHYFHDSKHKVTKKALKSAKLASKGSILLLVRGSMLFNKIPVGIATRDVTFNQDVKSINLNNAKSNQYLLLWLQAQENRLLNMVTGTGIGAGKLDTDELQSLPFISPCDELEQQKIASFLTSVDSKINQLTEKHRLLKEYKKGVMQQIFSQQLRFKNEDGKAFPAWERKSLGILGDIISGGTPSTDCKEYWNGNIYWVTPTDITKLSTRYIYQTARKITTEGLNNSSAKLVPKRSLLICTRATIGYMAITSKVMCTNQGFKNVIPYKNISVEFLYYILCFKKHILITKASGSTFLELSKKDFESIRITIPSLQEQQKIAQFLQAIDKKIDAVAEQIKQTKQFKKGLLQQMFV